MDDLKEKLIEEFGDVSIVEGFDELTLTIDSNDIV